MWYCYAVVLLLLIYCSAAGYAMFIVCVSSNFSCLHEAQLALVKLGLEVVGICTGDGEVVNIFGMFSLVVSVSCEMIKLW